MATSIPATATANADRFYTMVKSLNNFNNLEVRGVIRSLLARTDEENCFIGTYYRVGSNIETVLLLQNPTHFQAAAMLARTLFELAVDIRLLEIVPDASHKMNAFADVEKLRSARKAVEFKTANPSADVDVTVHSALVLNRAQDIEKRHRILWPNDKNPTSLSNVKHWSGHNLPERVKLLGAPFEEIYAVEYPRLSWYMHSGLTGVINLRAETFTYICSYAFKLSADAYSEVLETIIRRFELAKANENIGQKLTVAKLLPFADDPEHVNVLTKSIR